MITRFLVGSYSTPRFLIHFLCLRSRCNSSCCDPSSDLLVDQAVDDRPHDRPVLGDAPFMLESAVSGIRQTRRA